MTTFDFYIDKRKYNLNNNKVDIVLQHPILIDAEREYLKVKLVDFKYLNNLYNISGTLMNNEFNIRSYSRTYTYTITENGIYTDDLFYTPNGSNAFDTGGYVIATEDFNANTSTLSTIEKTHTYVYHSDLITYTPVFPERWWKNIFASNTTPNSRRMLLERNLKYIVINDTVSTLITHFNLSFMKSAILTQNEVVVFKIQRFNDTDNLYEDVGQLDLTFTPDDLYYDNYEVRLSTPKTSTSYKIICDTITTFDVYITELRGFNETYTFDTGTLSVNPYETTITIPDGFYKASTFVSTLNTLLTNFKLTSSINPYTNKLKITNNNDFTPTQASLTDLNGDLYLVLPNIENILENWGFEYQAYINIPIEGYIEGDKSINLINLSKIVITTDLNFKNKTHNELIKGNDLATGIGNILQWVDADEPPYTCIKYSNYENLEYRIENDYINNIRLSFYNEKSQGLVLDNALIHLQIRKYNKKSY